MFFKTANVSEVSVERVKQAIDTHEHCIIVDVRTVGEYQRGHIAGSVNIPLDQIDASTMTAYQDKTIPVYAYCLSGSRSIEAVQKLSALGYTAVNSMSHGVLAWRIKQFPLE